MEELKPLNETKTAIIDKKVEETFPDSFSAQKTEDKKEEAKKILFENNSPEALVEFHLKQSALSRAETESKPLTTKIQFEAVKSFFSENTEEEPLVEQKITTYIEPEVKEENEVEELVEVETISKEEIESEELVEIEETTDVVEEVQQKKRIKNKTGLKKRLKIITFGFFAVLTCFLGWSIYNAVEIETLRAQLAASNKAYGINIVNYISNISKVDDLTSDSLFNLTQLSEAGIIPLEPSQLEDHTQYNIKSNWFDRLCNWLSNIFK